jgi:hypothetical protein
VTVQPERKCGSRQRREKEKGHRYLAMSTLTTTESQPKKSERAMKTMTATREPMRMMMLPTTKRRTICWKVQTEGRLV